MSHQRIRRTCAAGLFFALSAATSALAQTPPTPSPTPAPTPTPAVTIGGDFTAYLIHSFQPNATGALDTPTGVDLPTRSDLSNLMLNLTGNAGKVRATASVGQYAFPTVGFAIVPDSQNGANTMLYTALPLATLQYTFDSHFNLSAGKFAALLGQESPFTWQNLNIQRGIGWAMEPTISRGVQAAYNNGPISLTVEENDAYYSGSNRAFEALAGWAPTSNTNLQFAFILPGANVPSNPTVSVGNKAEYDLMFTQQVGKVQFLPYFLWVDSPSSVPLGYTSASHATAGVLLADWAWGSPWSVAFRYENAHNGSSTTDTSPNADLIGYGPGSGAQTFTLTPAWRFGNSGVLRLEYSIVTLSSFTQGLGFGPGGTGGAQDRYGIEFGVMH